MPEDPDERRATHVARLSSEGGRPTEVVIAPPGPAVDVSELDRARQRVLAGIAEAFRSARSRPRPRDRRPRIDAYQLQVALADPEGLMRPERPFNPSPASSRRAIGLAALSRCMRDPALAPAKAVEEILTEVHVAGGRSNGGAWWEEWFRLLPDGAAAVVQAEATTWATQLNSALEWRRFDPQALLGRDYRFECTRSPLVTLHAQIDVEVRSQGKPVLLVAPTGIAGPYWSAALALNALVAGLAGGAGSGADASSVSGPLQGR